MVIKLLLDGWDGDLKDKIFRGTLEEVSELDVMDIVLRIIFPHLSVGLIDSDIRENFILILSSVDFDLKTNIFCDDGEKSTKRINEHFIDLVKCLNVVEVTITDLGDLVHENWIMISTETETIDGEIVFNLILSLECLDTIFSSVILTIREQENTCNIILVLSLLDHLIGQIHTSSDISTTRSTDTRNHTRNLLLV